jgi:hypothetical protein
LTRIESSAFSSSSLQSIIIPSTVQILGFSCFSYCKSLSSISFAHPSQFEDQLNLCRFDHTTGIFEQNLRNFTFQNARQEGIP